MGKGGEGKDGFDSNVPKGRSGEVSVRGRRDWCESGGTILGGNADPH
jgi:hypothetical protein